MTNYKIEKLIYKMLTTNTGIHMLDSGGWLTKTTKDRINKYLPDGCYISQKNHKWYLHQQGEDTRDFEDGMHLKFI